MESNVIKTASFLDPYVELKVRPKEFNFHYYLFPKCVIEKTIYWLRNSDIDLDDIPVNEETMNNFSMVESKYSIEEYDEDDCVAVQTIVDINELYEIITYLEKNPDEKIDIVLYKNSELPEFKDLLSDKAKTECSIEIQAALSSYMKLLLDMSFSGLADTIIEYGETASFGKLLKMYNEYVVQFIFSHISNRFETELRKEMLED